MQKVVFSSLLLSAFFALAACNDEQKSQTTNSQKPAAEQTKPAAAPANENKATAATENAVSKPVPADNIPAEQSAPAENQGNQLAVTAKNVVYQCGETELKVVYTIADTQVVGAQVFAADKEITPMLARVADNKDDNLFTDGTFTWSAELATAEELDKKDGNMLTKQAKTTVNGEEHEVSEIVHKYCELKK
ncbi:MAG: hypothetical protein IJ566_03590 [Cardiobacteriaceae bacterium]|nr:hypothetical protein [Cardiobacteriaceae bacterium]